MYENLEAFEEKFKSLEQDLMDVNIISDSKKYQKDSY